MYTGTRLQYRSRDYGASLGSYKPIASYTPSSVYLRNSYTRMDTSDVKYSNDHKRGL
ncbi:hypothetical protein HYX17_02415 [Candidatus Woesearchaeota archaeon]|nr:hypothetical protein [Candidatus Woesearchaeota archaeon]